MPSSTTIKSHDSQSRREQECAQLDAAQCAIWEKVLAGDKEAIELFLKIHDRRVKLLGLTTDKDGDSREWVVRVERE